MENTSGARGGSVEKNPGARGAAVVIRTRLLARELTLRPTSQCQELVMAKPDVCVLHPPASLNSGTPTAKNIQ